MLGLFVFPSELWSVAGAAVALAAILAFVARPVAVVVSTLFPRFSVRERALLAWGGLRGAVPIVLATFALAAGVEASGTIFNAVFFVVLLSALAQGMTLERLARRLRLATEARAFYQPPLEIGVIRGLGGDVLASTRSPRPTRLPAELRRRWAAGPMPAPPPGREGARRPGPGS